MATGAGDQAGGNAAGSAGDNTGGFTAGHRDSLPRFEALPGVRMAPLGGERLMLNLVWIEPGAVVPRHAHLHEQGGTVLEGELILTVGNERRVLRPGDLWVIAGDTPHGAVAGANGCLALDVFSPPRQDYLDRARAAGG